VVCDISRPASVGPQVRANRPDVTVFDGGVVHLPANSIIDLNIDLPAGMVYACMAETMILALEQQYQNTGLGTDLDIVQAVELERQAQRHGFKTALDLTMFERRLPDFHLVPRPQTSANNERQL
jgi:fatty aldehyde-generating acyl-ACP reductase